MFGSLTPELAVLGSAYLAFKRYKWLRSSEFIQSSGVVSKATLRNGNRLEVESIELFKRNTYSFDVSKLKSKLVEGDGRKDSYYLIQDPNTNKTFVLPIVDEAVIDRKFLNWIGKIKSDDSFSILNTLTKYDSAYIDVTQSYVKDNTNEIENIARINILAEQNLGFDISTLTPQELNQKLNNILDSQVKEYIRKTKESVSSKPAIEFSLVEVENFLVSLKLSSEEATNITKYFRKQFKIDSLKDLKILARSELTEAIKLNTNKSQSEIETVVTEINAFFKSLSN
jgi:hypothetical protein